jgi:Uma2 family endonuclease
MPVANADSSDDYIAAIAHLPAGVSLRVDDVTWEEYEQLLADLGDDYAVRIFYDQGGMEIMSPDSIHEKHKSIIHRLISALSDELDIDVESFGSTTFRRKIKSKGAEPDDCFYVQNASLVIGKRGKLDLSHDPPPDLVLEIDHTSASLDKFPIYAGLGVPEIWRLSKDGVQIHLLTEEGYEQSSTSRAFPFLTSDALSLFLEQGLSEGERKTTRVFRAWVREHRSDS